MGLNKTIFTLSNDFGITVIALLAIAIFMIATGQIMLG